MTAIHAGAALLAGGWAKDVRIICDDGVISSVETGVSPQPQDERHAVIVPAMPNLHSHAFQRAMAGLAEIRGPGDDSFWSWRTVMYRFALSMTPDHVEAVAAQLYMEMLEAGFGRVGEFHYLHNDRDGSHYGNIAEMAERIGAAASRTGIGLTLLPVFYAHSGFGGQAPIDGQKRFIHSLDSYGKLMQGAQGVVDRLPGAVLGIAPHSLRAVTGDELTAIEPLAKGGPIHIHVAEQTKEVDDSLAFSSARPVEWLLDNAPVDGRWCLIHATHMTETETRRMAKSGAVAGLCPITEANLGDGIFPAPNFLAESGHYGVGSDSNILISVPEELRTLEYSQRLSLRARNVIADAGCSTGEKLFLQALQGGGRALASRNGVKKGKSADFVALDVSAVSYLPISQILDQWIFAGGIAVDSVWVRGKKLVQAGRHIHRHEISGRFNKVMAELLDS
ncbi:MULTISPECIES: formimidoylglutamate deiminase [Agrobacterium]|uniref:Formimidoylglutamate deiminase n=1 Tax=Agrobacterium tumefaciens TaxID=358 RepID=A0AAE6EH18_AGRTU|nr:MULTISPECIES: formimidoylglutamate deiminase [Agrobacterium]QCL75835.1 formimidoylglutamate deiminase [Agrobacterium tumefaciens]QCL81395.1 formimidoylglutamate deiminase [Agrobacterium tumefaciens]CUX54245.1 putative formiminoglutamate deiminase HutF [Agrobacterium sp. NCPPB 925]